MDTTLILVSHIPSSISLLLAAAPQGQIDPHLEENSLHFGAVLAHLLIHDGVEDVLGRDAGIGNAFVVAHHPDENVRNRVLGLGMPRESPVSAPALTSEALVGLETRWRQIQQIPWKMDMPVATLGALELF